MDSNIKERIMNILLQNDVITTSQIATITGISSKTIRKYIKVIEQEEDINITMKSRVGIIVDIDDEKRKKLSQKYIENMNEITQEKIENYIKSIFFMINDTYTISSFAQDLNLNNAKINGYLKQIEVWFNFNDLNLKRKTNRGLWLEGSEENIRKAFFRFISKKREILNIYDYHLKYRLKFDIDKDLKDKFDIFFSGIDINYVYNQIKYIEKALNVKFTQTSFTNNLIYFLITIQRIKIGKNIESKNIKEYNKDLKTREYQLILQICRNLEKKFNIKIGTADSKYLFLNLIISKFVGEVKNDVVYESKLEALTKEIINNVGEIVQVDFSNDSKLYDNLIHHLNETLIKINYYLSMQNPLLDSIKKEYSSLFSAIWICNNLFEKYFGYTLTEDEIGYITLHFSVAMLKNKVKIKTCLQTNTNEVVTYLLENKLKQQFNELDITLNVDYNNINNYDLILSTYDLENDNFLLINSILTDDDINNINKKIFNIKSKKYSNSKRKNILYENTFCFIENGNNFEEIMKKYSKYLTEKDYVKPGFYEDIIKRERINSTNIGYNIQLPHCKSTYVKKSSILIIKLKDRLEYNGNKMNIIFLLSIKKEDVENSKEFFKKLYYIINTKNNLKKFYSIEKEQEMKNFFWEEI